MKILLVLSFVFFNQLLFAQTILERDIKSFGAKGDGKTNDHAAFEKAAAFFRSRGGNGKLMISRGTYLIGKQTFNASGTNSVYEGSNVLDFSNVKNMTIEGQSKAVLKYTNGLKFGAFEPKTGKAYQHGNNYFVKPEYKASIGCAILISNSAHVQIKNLELNGNSDGLVLGGVYGDVGIQIPHIGIWIINSSNILVDQVNAHHFGLDGIMISNATGEKTTPDQVRLLNSSFNYNARQGLSWIGGNDLVAVNCQFNHTGRGKFSSAPSAGVDIEAEVGKIRNGRFTKCEFINNAGNGLVADSGPSSNCTFTDCIFWGVTSWSLWINKPGFTVINSKIHGSFVHGYDAANDLEATKFIGCLFEDKPYMGKEPFGAYLIETNYKKRVRFDDCRMIAHKKKITWMEASPAWKPEEKYQLNNCHLIFTGEVEPAGGWVALTRSIRFKNTTFEIKDPEAKKKGYWFNGVEEGYNVNVGGNKIIVYQTVYTL